MSVVTFVFNIAHTVRASWPRSHEGSHTETGSYMRNHYECCCSKEMIQKFKQTLSQCVNEIDAILGSDSDISGRSQIKKQCTQETKWAEGHSRQLSRQVRSPAFFAWQKFSQVIKTGIYEQSACAHVSGISKLSLSTPGQEDNI